MAATLGALGFQASISLLLISPLVCRCCTCPHVSCALRACQIEALRSEVTLAVERSDSRAAEQRANAAVKEAQVSDRCVRLQQELEDSRVSSGC